MWKLWISAKESSLSFKNCGQVFQRPIQSWNCSCFSKLCFWKGWVGFNPKSKNKPVSKPFSSFFEKQPIVLSKQLVEKFFYCIKMSHTVRLCRVRRFSIPKGNLKWVPKVPTNIIGPKFVRGPNLAPWSCFLQGSLANKHLRYLDSGCSKHMTGDKSKFFNIFLKQEGHVTYGDNNKGKILERWTIGDKNTFLINDVLFVEGLKHNLLSIS